ncbi:MAG: hypothetical protein KJ057_12355 [Phycisphaerae bacterium]|nr:MAG: hypothetical protein EDS66_12070 [Planctomycetota bacterium]KAB2950110.1 MAG: hypothetical protein F9K17_00630 [Phycisphaerae bacterium]MBE7456444.1 hypothetical protein [Planctomycetia bacterium]MCK6465347.1 hypothetical protein [Phycisphaerae bacterium]MCL4719256.1 hypothetical protein [Phycisphaerae bacterium]
MTTRTDSVPVREARTPHAPEQTSADNARSRRRRRRRAFGITCVLILLGAITLWLALHRIPAWYRPMSLADEHVADVRFEATAWVDWISDQMVQGRSFTIEMTEAQANRLLAGARRDGRDSGGSWPAALEAPAVAFLTDELRVGAILRRKGDHVVVSAGLRLRASPDDAELRVRLDAVRAGVVALPAFLWTGEVRSWLERTADASSSHSASSSRSASTDSLRSVLSGLDDPEALARDGFPIRNRFRWPNGNRAFTVDNIEITPGRCRILIHPL